MADPRTHTHAHVHTRTATPATGGPRKDTSDDSDPSAELRVEIRVLAEQVKHARQLSVVGLSIISLLVAIISIPAIGNVFDPPATFSDQEAATLRQLTGQRGMQNADIAGLLETNWDKLRQVEALSDDTLRRLGELDYDRLTKLDDLPQNHITTAVALDWDLLGQMTKAETLDTSAELCRMENLALLALEHISFSGPRDSMNGYVDDFEQTIAHLRPLTSSMSADDRDRFSSVEQFIEILAEEVLTRRYSAAETRLRGLSNVEQEMSRPLAVAIYSMLGTVRMVQYRSQYDQEAETFFEMATRYFDASALSGSPLNGIASCLLYKADQLHDQGKVQQAVNTLERARGFYEQYSAIDRSFNAYFRTLNNLAYADTLKLHWIALDPDAEAAILRDEKAETLSREIKSNLDKARKLAGRSAAIYESTAQYYSVRVALAMDQHGKFESKRDVIVAEANECLQHLRSAIQRGRYGNREDPQQGAQRILNISMMNHLASNYEKLFDESLEQRLSREIAQHAPPALTH
jgi:hypothetical protein